MLNVIYEPDTGISSTTFRAWNEQNIFRIVSKQHWILNTNTHTHTQKTPMKMKIQQKRTRNTWIGTAGPIEWTLTKLLVTKNMKHLVCGVFVVRSKFFPWCSLTIFHVLKIPNGIKKEKKQWKVAIPSEWHVIKRLCCSLNWN